MQKLVSPLRSVEGSSARTHPERKESCQKLASTMASLVVTEKMCCQSCVSNVGTVQPDAWVRQLLTGRVRQTVRVRFWLHSSRVRGLKRILVRSDNERSSLSLIERVRNDLTGVELVQMTSPEGDHASRRSVFVKSRPKPRILRSQLEQRLGHRIDEKDSLMSWIPRHAANCVSRYRLMDDVVRLISDDVERLGNAQWWSLVSHCISDQLV